MFQHHRQAGVIAGLALSLLALLPVFVHAQAVGSLTGRVVDATGGVIPGVEVTITSDVAGATTRTLTNADGEFVFRDAVPGRYRLRAFLEGFKAFNRDLVVTAGEPIRLDVALEVGPVAAWSHIGDAEPPLIEAYHAALGLLIPNRDLIELPLNGRNFTQLGTLMPGVIAPPAALGGQAGDATPGGFGNATGGFNVNGMRNQSNNFLLDGAPNNDSFNTGFVLRPPPDAIDEFRIFTHAFNAEYGRNAGAVVSVVTRAGSREWRGSGWWFDRDDALEARNRFAVTKPALDQHQFGGTAGGPIVENKAFVFGYYEGFRNRRGTTDTRVVPSAAQRAGDFSGGPAIRDPLTGQPFPGNVIPAARLDGIAAQLLDDYVPLPNQPDNRYTQSPDVLDRRNQFGVRVDHNVNESNKVLARVHAARTEQRNPLGPANFSPAGNVARAGLLDALLSATTVFGPTAVNEARVSINRIDAEPNVTSGLDPRDLGFAITPSNPTALGLPNIGVNGFFTVGDAQQPFASRVNDVLTIADDLTKVAGRHTVKTGVEVRRDRIVLAFINRPNGNFTFNGQYTGNAAADFLLGLPQQYRQAAGDPNMDGHTWATSVYVQDDWRVADGLSVQAGLRYERAAPFVERGDKLNAFHPGQQSTRFPAAPAGLVYPGDPGVPRGTYETDGNNVAPRVGVVWDVGGSGTTVVRGGWGMFYDTPAGQGDFFQNGTLAPPFQPLTEVTYSVASLDSAFPGPARRSISWDIRLPAGAHLHRLGTALHHAAGPARPSVRAAQRRRRRRPRGRLRRVARAQPADVHGSEPDDAGARADSAARSSSAACIRPRPAQPGRGAVVVRLAAGQRQGPQVARPDGAAVVHVGACDRPRVGDQHRRRGAADAAGLARRSRCWCRGRRSTRRWPARRATRCSTRATASCSAPTTCCRRSTIVAGSCGTRSAAGR